MARKTKESEEQNEIMASSEQGEASQVEHDAHYRSRCGGALRTARENQGFSVPDIASRLRLSAKQIEAIEADNFAALPEPTIVRGFIRNYAKQLKINAEPLLDAYNVLVPSATPHELIVKPSANMKMTSREKPKAGNYVWAGLLVFLGLGAWLFYQHYIQKPSPTAPSASVESAEPLPEVALPAAERAVEPQAAPQTSTELTMPPAPASPPSASAEPAVDAAANQATTSVNNAVPITTQLAAPPAATELAPVTPGKARLEFNANQETWVNVLDASGREVYSKTIFAGSRDSFEVTLPVNITVGNAGATSLNMNGKSVELAPHMRGNVARLKLE